MRHALNEFQTADRLSRLGHKITNVIAATDATGAVIELTSNRQVWLTGERMCVLFVNGEQVHKSPDERQIRVIDRHLRATDEAARRWPIVVWS